MTKQINGANRIFTGVGGSGNFESSDPNGTVSNFPYDDTRSVIAGAYHVDPVSGSDSNNGILVGETGGESGSVAGDGPWLTIDANITTLSPTSAATSTMYLRQGTHVVGTVNLKFLGSDGTVTNPIHLTSYPGESPVIDVDGGGLWLHVQNKDYWTFDYLKVINYQSCWGVGQDVTADNCRWFSIEGSTGIGGDNAALIRVIGAGAQNLDIDRIKVSLTVDPATVHQNTAGLYITNSNSNISGAYDHIESYNFPNAFYYKHGDPDLISNSGDITVSNSIFIGTRNSYGYNQAGVIFDNCIFGSSLNMAQADGGEAGDWNIYDHCTIFVQANLQDQDQSSNPGAQNNKFLDCVITELNIAGDSSVTSDSNYNLFPANSIDNKGTPETLAQWRTSNSSDANSVEGTPVYEGSDFDLIASYALAAGSPGKGVASDAEDMGVDVSLIGVAA